MVRGNVVFENKQLDDFVLIKSDGFPTYHFANVVDDHLMQITHVIRAEEWVSSTPKHLLLYRPFGFTPPLFVHVPLILGPDRSKLSKRHGDTSLLEYRDKGYIREALVNFLALLGWAPGNDLEIMPGEELIQKFTLENISKSASIFDIQKLEWMNKKYMAGMDEVELLELAKPYLLAAGSITETDFTQKQAWLIQVIHLFKERLDRLDQVAVATKYFFIDDFDYEEKGVTKYFSDEAIIGHIGELKTRIEKLPAFNAVEIEQVVRKLAEERTLSASQIIHPVRLAVSGTLAGPGLFEMMEVIGRDKVLQRLQRVIEKFT